MKTVGRSHLERRRSLSLVHGGGRAISAQQAALGLPVVKVAGLRVTDAAALAGGLLFDSPGRNFVKLVEDILHGRHCTGFRAIAKYRYAWSYVGMMICSWGI